MFFILVAILSAGGCNSKNLKTSTKSSVHQLKTNIVKKKSLPSFIERRKISLDEDRKVTMLFIKIDQKKWQWFSQNKPDKALSISQWQEKLNASLVINGFYFDEKEQPTGFYQVAKGAPSKIKWPSIENQKKNNGYTGLVTITKNNELRLKYLPYSPQPEPNADSSNFLSFPTLVAGGFPLLTKDSKKYARRLALGMDREDNIYIIITELGNLTLYELAQWISQQPEKIDIAINLDGGKSTSLIYKQNNFQLLVPAIKLPNVLYLKKRI